MEVIFKEKTNTWLTKGKPYKVAKEGEDSYTVKDDEGDFTNHFKKRFDVVESKQLKVGDVLLAKDLEDWCKVSENYFFDKWTIKNGRFSGNRTIEKIDVKEGHKAFLVSNTLDVWVKYKGYRKFCERNYSKINFLKEEIDLIKVDLSYISKSIGLSEIQMTIRQNIIAKIENLTKQ